MVERMTDKIKNKKILKFSEQLSDKIIEAKTARRWPNCQAYLPNSPAGSE